MFSFYAQVLANLVLPILFKEVFLVAYSKLCLIAEEHGLPTV